MNVSIACPSCGSKLKVPESAAGRKAKCPKCGTALTVPTLRPNPQIAEQFSIPEPDPELEAHDDEDVQGSIWYTARATIVTVVVTLVSIFTIIGLIVIRQNPEPARRLLGNLGDFLADSLGKAGSFGMAVLGAVVVIVIVVVVVAYIPFVFVMAGYVARDANNRNHSGLGWAVFYLAFQFLGLALVPSSGILWLFGSFLALAGAFVGFLFGWTGFGIYLIARRRGIPTTCRNCLNKRLPYFAVCPHCGLPSNSGENERTIPPSVQETTAFSSPS